MDALLVISALLNAITAQAVAHVSSLAVAHFTPPTLNNAKHG